MVHRPALEAGAARIDARPGALQTVLQLPASPPVGGIVSGRLGVRGCRVRWCRWVWYGAGCGVRIVCVRPVVGWRMRGVRVPEGRTVLVDVRPASVWKGNNGMLRFTAMGRTCLGAVLLFALALPTAATAAPVRNPGPNATGGGGRPFA